MSQVKPSLPKGTRDFLPQQMYRRQFVMDTLRSVFESFGYQPVETPSIEKLSVLSGKYGDEGEQLIFKVLRRGTGLEDLLKDRDDFVVKEYGELVNEALRYDLTVPFSRVVAMHQSELVLPFKRYQMQPVWRADRPQRGRYREFYQCDIDSVGTSAMLADAETIAVVYHALVKLGFEKFVIRLNNRKILNGVLENAGIQGPKGDAALLTIDKLDKIGLSGVHNELVQRGFSESQAAKILSVIEMDGSAGGILQKVEQALNPSETLREGLAETREILSFLPSLQVPAEVVKVDLCLARGLGYYTGPIFESVVEEPKIGSITGGGRYDGLVGMFLGRDIPATGTSFGIERIIDVMTQLEMFPGEEGGTQVLVLIFDASTQTDSLAFTQELRNSGVRAESFLEVAKLKKQFSYADKKGIPFVVIIGPDEAAENKVTVRDMSSGQQVTHAHDNALEFFADRFVNSET